MPRSAFSIMLLAFRPIREDRVLLVEPPLVQRVDFDIDMRVLGTNALGEVKLNNSIIISLHPSAYGVQNYFHTTVEVPLERGSEVELEVQREVA